MYKLVNALVTKVEIKAESKSIIHIDYDCAERRWCAFDDKNNIVIDLINGEEYTYLPTLSGLYVLNSCLLSNNEYYAMEAVMSLLDVPEHIEEKFNKFIKKKTKQKIYKK